MAFPRTSETLQYCEAALRKHAEEFPSLFRGVLPTSAPSDSICLDLPWGRTRNFLVPADDPRNPKFQTRPKRKPEANSDRVITLDAVRYSTVFLPRT